TSYTLTRLRHSEVSLDLHMIHRRRNLNRTKSPAHKGPSLLKKATGQLICTTVRTIAPETAMGMARIQRFPVSVARVHRTFRPTGA
ncbi:MAG: hypothetical protein ACRD1G_01400, partial [Acidimicrobiales bacterium]